MKNNRLARRKGNDDRRRTVDRRDGIERRTQGLPKVSADENNRDIVYTTKEACEYLKISRPTYLKYISTGRIKATKIGRGWRTLKSELDRFIRGG